MILNSDNLQEYDRTWKVYHYRLFSKVFLLTFLLPNTNNFLNSSKVFTDFLLLAIVQLFCCARISFVIKLMTFDDVQNQVSEIFSISSLLILIRV